MAEGWTQDRVTQLAPDAASLKAGQGLAHTRKWVSSGRDGSGVWGECQGSGAKPYQVQVDLSDAASKCSCPSRKFPCKHALGLLLLLTASDKAVSTTAAPDWVTDWRQKRDEAAKKKQEKAAAPAKPVDEAAQAQRREKRLSRVADGLAALKTWSEDLVRGGIAGVPTKEYAFFDEPARRMVDAQAPGVARMVRDLGSVRSAGGGWQRPFMDGLSSLHLLIRAFERIDTLPEPTREDILSTLGVPSAEDTTAFPRVHDTWQVIGRELEEEERLRVQRTWLFGTSSRRIALVLAFAHGTTMLDASLCPATAFEGDIAFYPGHGVRAVVLARGEATSFPRLEGFGSLDSACDMTGAIFAEQPWLEEIAIPLRGVVPLHTEAGWQIVDLHKGSLPALLSTDGGQLALATSGGHPIDLVATYDSRRLRPLAILTGGAYVSLSAARRGGYLAASASDSRIDELMAVAAVGTSRKSPSIDQDASPLSDAIRAAQSESPEANLLGALSIVNQFEASGRLPSPGPALPEPAADETRPDSTRRGAELLSTILALPDTPLQAQLIEQWLGGTKAVGRRIPHRLLPALLEYGVSHRPPREAIAELGGTRGAWLMRHHTRWQFALAEEEDPRSIWSTGTGAQRLGAAERLRRTDPAAARELVFSTWSEDAAEDRARFLASFATSLSANDEPSLERALDDRSKQVRAVAATLLSSLPASAYVKRMIERVSPLVRYQPEKSGLLRKSVRAQLEFELPPQAYDPTWARDGIDEKPEERMGTRQSRLVQILGGIPLTYWSDRYALAPEDCVGALTGEYADVVLAGWHRAAARNPTNEWIAALLLAAARDGRGPMSLELLNTLHGSSQQVITTEVLESPKADLELLSNLLRVTRFPFERAAARALFRVIDHHLESSNTSYPYIVAQLLPEAAVRVPPGMYDDLAGRWVADRFDNMRKAVNGFLQTLALRRNLQTEFTS